VLDEEGELEVRRCRSSAGDQAQVGARISRVRAVGPRQSAAFVGKKKMRMRPSRGAVRRRRMWPWRGSTGQSTVPETKEKKCERWGILTGRGQNGWS
jgi:hypothetical protein